MIFANGKIKEGLFHENVYVGPVEDAKLKKIKEKSNPKKMGTKRSTDFERDSVFEQSK